MKKKMRVAVYCRTAAQDKYAMEEQEQKVKEFVNKHDNWILEKTYYVCESGIKNDLSILERHATEHKFDIIAVQSMDRLSRQFDKLIEFYNKMKALGIPVLFADGVQIKDISEHVLKLKA